jgi:predicted metalloendopeptidase
MATLFHYFWECMAMAPILQMLSGTSPNQEVHGISIANMARGVMPGDNLYLYANGDWIRRTAIPEYCAGLTVFSSRDDPANKNTAVYKAFEVESGQTL